MASIMFDSDNPAVLADARCTNSRVATYADLITPQHVAVFAGRLVVIDRGRGDPLNLATVADIEDGALSIADGAALIAKWTQEGRPYPTAYHDRANWQAINDALLHIGGWHWIATLDGTLVPEGHYPAVVQFAGEQVAGFHVDVSIVWNEGWHPQADGINPGQLARLQQLATQAENSVHAVLKAAMAL